MKPFKKFVSRNSDERKDFSKSRKSEFNRRDPNRDSGFKMHKATCDKCGKECEVPFKPTGNKPVYCRDCFRQNSDVKSPKSDYGKPRYDQKSEFNDKFESRNTTNHSSDELDKINRKLDKIMKALKIE